MRLTVEETPSPPGSVARRQAPAGRRRGVAGPPSLEHSAAMQENERSPSGPRNLQSPSPMSSPVQGCSDRAPLRRAEPARRRWAAGVRVLASVLLVAVLGVGALFPETTERVPAYTPYAGGDWPTADARDYGYDPQSLSEAVERIGADEGVYSVLLVRGGELIAEQYFREGTRTKIHNLKSASKSIVSTLVGLVIADGALSLEDSVVEVLDVRGVEPDRRAITVRDVLMMASGLESTSYEAYNAWIAGSDWVRGALRQERLDPPGTRYRYSTGNTHLLSALVRRASRRSTRSFAEVRLFDPLDIKVGGWETDPQGIHIGGNNLALTPRDMAKFGELFLRGGRWGDQQVVPAEWVREATRIQIASDHEVYGDYGYQWFVSRRIPGDFIAVGFGGQYIYVSPAYDSVVVVTSTLESKGREWEHRVFDVIEQDLLRADGVRITSRRDPGVAEETFGPAGATQVARESQRPPQGQVTRERTPQPSTEALAAELTSAKSQVATLTQRVETLETEREQETLLARQRLERTERDRQQLDVELERSRRALEESGRERARLAQLLEAAEGREALAAQETASERERAAARAATHEAEQTRMRQLLADNNDEIAALRSQAQTRDLELDRVRAELSRVERRVEDRDATVRDRDAVLEQQLEQFEAERADLETSLAEERSRADQTLRDMQKMRQTESSLREDLDTRGRDLATARERAQVAEQALQARDARLASLQRDLETLREQGRASAAERTELDQSLLDLQGRLEAALAEEERLETLLSASSGAEELARTRGDELAGMRAARDAEATARGLAENETEALRTSLGESHEQVATLESDLDRLRARLSEQERAGSDAAAESAELARARTEESSELRAALRVETDLRREAETAVDALQSSLEQEQTRSTSLQSELDQLRRRLSEQERNGAEAATLAGSLEQASSRIASLQAELSELQRLEASGRREADQLSQRLRESQQASAIQVQQLAELRTEVGEARQQNAAFEAEVRELRQQLQSASERLTASAGRDSQAVQIAERRANALEEQLAAATADSEAARAQAADLEQQLARARDRLLQGSRDQEGEIEALRREVTASADRIATLEGRLTEVRRTSESRRIALQQAEAAAQERQDDGRVDELLAQLEARDQSLAALQEELATTRRTNAAASASGDDATRVRQNYEALVAESEMLARRAGEQGRRIAELEQRLAATRTPADLDRELRAVRAEVERLLSDRRLSEVLRADLVRLRRVLVALQSARERGN